uniref:Methyltransferase type 11 domain-containing protein n=2 Tax=Ciona intestinalis TaxID=7719 RepID=F6UYV3_CIOIN
MGSGTGNIGQALHEHRFIGVIDGVEGNSEMNAVAEQKNMHRNLIVHFLTPDTPVPLDDASYDVITCCASLSPRSLPASTVLEMVRLLKPGGYIWYTTRDTSQHSIYNSKLNGLIDEMIQSEKVKDIIRRSFSYYTYEVKSENGGTEMFSLPGIERVLKIT